MLLIGPFAAFKAHVIGFFPTKDSEDKDHQSDILGLPFRSLSGWADDFIPFCIFNGWLATLFLFAFLVAGDFLPFCIDFVPFCILKWLGTSFFLHS